MADKLKNLLLCVLLLLMALLLVLTFIVSVRGSRSGSLLQSLEENETVASSGVIRPAAQPEKLALIGPEGLFLDEDQQAYELLYQQAEPLWQEAVGSAGTLEQLSENAYLQLLRAPAVLLQYHTAQPLYLLQAWSGSEALRGDMEVGSVALAGEGEGVVLLVTDREGGRWKAQTAASYEELENLCASLPADNSVLAGTNRVLAGDEVLTRTVGSYQALKTETPEMVRKGELSQSIQALFGMNAYLTKVYSNADGSLVYVESHSTISLSPEGDLIYSGEGIDLGLTAAEGLNRQVEVCQKVYEQVNDLWEQAGASGQLSLEELQFQGRQGVLRFGLHMGGVFLERQEGDWVTVTVEDGIITGVTAALRQLEPVETVRLLPLYQAAATLQSGRGSLRVRLLEQTDGSWQPQICFVTED